MRAGSPRRGGKYSRGASYASSDSRTEVTMSNSPGSTPGARGPATGRGGSRPLPDSAARGSAGHRTWDIGTGDAASVVAVDRRALFVMASFIVLIWSYPIAHMTDQTEYTTLF